MNYKKQCICEALIKGELIKFDAQSIGDLKEAILYYSVGFQYAGTTKIVFYDGVKDPGFDDHHIFIYKK